LEDNKDDRIICYICGKDSECPVDPENIGLRCMFCDRWICNDCECACDGAQAYLRKEHRRIVRQAKRQEMKRRKRQKQKNKQPSTK